MPCSEGPGRLDKDAVKGRPVSRKTIAVIEDEPDIREIMTYNLEREGFDVEACGDGDEVGGSNALGMEVTST